MYAVQKCNSEIVKLLIYKGVNLNAKSYRNRTALYIAKLKGYDNIVYIESFAHYLIIHSKSANVRVREKLSTTLDKLKPYGFI